MVEKVTDATFETDVLKASGPVVGRERGLDSRSFAGGRA